jgi:hypothetical protein
MGRGANKSVVEQEPRAKMWAEDNYKGLPRPIYDDPELGLKPVPWTTEAFVSSTTGKKNPEFASADPERLNECWEESLCVLCGEALEERVHAFIYQGEAPDGVGNEGCITDGPMHGRCQKITAAHCPPMRDGLENGRIRSASFDISVWEELRKKRAIRASENGDAPSEGFEPLSEELASYV